MISKINIRFSFTEFIVKPFEANRIQRKIGANPEKYLMSSMLKTQQTKEPIPQDLNLSIKDKYEPRYLERTKDYAISRQQYNQYAHMHPHGKVHLFNYQDINFTIAGSAWEHVPNKNLYKLLIYTRPNAILLQMRPDQVLLKFDTDFHSSKEYIKQITRNGEEIMPSGYAEKIQKELQLDQMEFPEFIPYNIKERINYDKIATISYYAQMNNIPILLIDLPEKVFRYSLANQLTLVQLQEYFKEAVRLTPQHPDILPNTPMNIAYQVFPDIFLKKSDEFMTTIIEYLAAKKEYKKVFALVGNMQSDSIVNILENKVSSHLKRELEIPKIKGSLFKQLTCEDLLERHSILDVMYNGKDLFYELDKIKIRFQLLFSTSLRP